MDISQRESSSHATASNRVVTAPPVINTSAAVKLKTSNGEGAFEFPRRSGSFVLTSRRNSGEAAPSDGRANSSWTNSRDTVALASTRAPSVPLNDWPSGPSTKPESEHRERNLGEAEQYPNLGDSERESSRFGYKKSGTSRFRSNRAKSSRGGRRQNRARMPEYNGRFTRRQNGQSSFYDEEPQDDIEYEERMSFDHPQTQMLNANELSILKKATPTASTTAAEPTNEKYSRRALPKNTNKSRVKLKVKQSSNSLKVRKPHDESETPDGRGNTPSPQETAAQQQDEVIDSNRAKSTVAAMQDELKRVKAQLNSTASARMSDAQRANAQKLTLEKKNAKLSAELLATKRSLRAVQKEVDSLEQRLLVAQNHIRELESNVATQSFTSPRLGHSVSSFHVGAAASGAASSSWASSKYMKALSQGAPAEANAAAAAMWGNNTMLSGQAASTPQTDNVSRLSLGGDAPFQHRPHSNSYHSTVPKVVSTRLPKVETKKWTKGKETTSELVDTLLNEAVMAAAEKLLGIEVRENQVVIGLSHQEICKAPYAPDKGVTLRPQDLFDPKPNNDEDTRFTPLIVTKPHATVPLNHAELKAKPWLSPYRVELSRLGYTEEQLSRPEALAEIVEMAPDEKVVWVDTLEGLEELLGKLMQPEVKELAVDLENHSERSFQGFLCLMQLSTRKEDFVVDCLALRKELWRLNEVFANPHVVKVLHGADMDILWLQRDLGLYIVNLFDTGQAARELHYPSFSLAHLLFRFVKIRADKSLQLADWRVRPLTREMLQYAQQDTHYLLDIYDRMRTELLDLDDELKGRQQGGCQSRLEAVLHRSSDLCHRTYVKDQYSWERQWSRVNRFGTRVGVALGGIQTQVLASLCQWRDTIARIRDESPGYVLPEPALLTLAFSCPGDKVELLDCFRMPFAQLGKKHQEIPIPQLVALFTDSVLATIAAAMDVAEDAETVSEEKPKPSESEEPTQHPTSAAQFGHDGVHSMSPVSMFDHHHSIMPSSLMQMNHSMVLFPDSGMDSGVSMPQMPLQIGNSLVFSSEKPPATRSYLADSALGGFRKQRSRSRKLGASTRSNQATKSSSKRTGSSRYAKGSADGATVSVEDASPEDSNSSAKGEAEAVRGKRRTRRPRRPRRHKGKFPSGGGKSPSKSTE